MNSERRSETCEGFWNSGRATREPYAVDRVDAILNASWSRKSTTDPKSEGWRRGTGAWCCRPCLPRVSVRSSSATDNWLLATWQRPWCCEIANSLIGRGRSVVVGVWAGATHRLPQTDGNLELVNRSREARWIKWWGSRPGLSSAWPGEKEFFKDKTIKTCRYLSESNSEGGRDWREPVAVNRVIVALASSKSGSPILSLQLKQIYSSYEYKEQESNNQIN